MRRVLLIIAFLLLLPQTTIFTEFWDGPHGDESGEILADEISPQLANSAGLDIILADLAGAPVYNAVVDIYEGWTGVKLVDSVAMTDSSRMVFSSLPAGPLRVHVNHLSHASEWMLAYGIDGVNNAITIQLSPLNASLEVATEPNADVTLYLDYHDQPLHAIADAEGNATIAVLESASGWLLAESTTGSSLSRWNGSAALSAQANERVHIFGWSPQANQSGVLRIEHAPSGWNTLVEWNGEINASLPVTSEGSWSAGLILDGQRSSDSISFSNVSQYDISQQLNSSVGAPEQVAGSGALAFTNEIEEGNQQNFSWSANITQPLDHGSDLLPEKNLGLRQQTDRWLGNRDGIVNQTEAQNMVAHLEANGWAEAALWTLYDENPLMVDSGSGAGGAGNSTGSNNGVLLAITDSQLVGSTSDTGGTISWTESANLIGQSSFSSVRKIWFPIRGHSLEGVLLDVDLPTGWEVRYSPQLELLGGEPWHFTVERANAAVVGVVTVTIGANQPPIAQGSAQGLDASVPLSLNTTFISGCSDSGIDSMTHFWELKHNNSTLTTNDSETFSIILEDHGFAHSDTVNVTLTCSDRQGLSGSWQNEWYVDGMAPTAQIYAIEDHLLPGDPLWPDMNNVSEFYLLAGSYLTVDANASDDSGDIVDVIWRSNKSQGWEYNDYRFNDQFTQGDEVNWLNMEVEERHLQRNLTVWSLEMELRDSAGNSNITNWNITMLDSTPPTITAEVLVDGLHIGPINVARPDSNVTVNLTRSFDDIDAIENLRWGIILNEQELVWNASWDEVQFYRLPQMESGEHDLRVVAWDTMGNTRELKTNPSVEPTLEVDLEGVSVVMDGEPDLGKGGLLQVTLRNLGGNPANLTLCYLDQCSPTYTSPVSTATTLGQTAFPLTVEDFKQGDVIVTVKWSDPATGDSGEFEIDSGLDVQGPLADFIRLVAIVLVLGAIIVWLGKSWLGFSERPPF